MISIAAIFIFLSAWYFGSESKQHAPELCTDGVIYFDPYQPMYFNFESYQDNMKGDRDKGGMLIPEEITHDYPGLKSTPIIRSNPLPWNSGGSVPCVDKANLVSEPSMIAFYAMAFLIAASRIRS